MGKRKKSNIPVTSKGINLGSKKSTKNEKEKTHSSSSSGLRSILKKPKHENQGGTQSNGKSALTVLKSDIHDESGAISDSIVDSDLSDSDEELFVQEVAEEHSEKTEEVEANDMKNIEKHADDEVGCEVSEDSDWDDTSDSSGEEKDEKTAEPHEFDKPEEENESDSDEDEVVAAIRKATEPKARRYPRPITLETEASAISFHPYKEVIAVGDMDGTVLIHKYSNEENQLLYALKNHGKRSVRCVEFSDEGNYLISACRGQKIVLVDSSTAKPKAIVKEAHEQIQMVRPDLIPDTTLLNVRNPFLKLPKKMIDEAEFSSSNEINATFQRAYVESGPVAKIRRLELLPEDPTYAEIRSRKEKEIAYVTQVKHFCEFMPLMPTLKLPNLVASCLREVNLHPVVAVKMSEPEKWQLNRWIYLTLECGLLDSRKRTGKDLAYLLRHLKRFVAGTGMDLPGIFVILAEFLLNWDGLTFRTELFNLLPYLPIQLAKFEDIKKGLLNPLVKMASYGDEAFKDETLRCIGQLIVRLRYKSHLEELNDPELVKKNSKKHYRLSAFFQYTCNLFLSGPGAGYPIFRRILAEYACIFDCETSTNLDRFSTVPVALISAIASSCHTDLFCCLCKLLNGYFAVLSESSDLPFQESLREIQSVLKGLFLPKNPRNLTKRICFFPVIAAYATKLNLSFKESCLKIDDSPDLLLPVLEEEAPFIYKLMISIYLSSK